MNRFLSCHNNFQEMKAYKYRMTSKMIVVLMTGIWLGLLIGLSFIEAPLKFQAPGITIELGLGIYGI